MNASMTIIGGRKSKTILERTMKGIFIGCGLFAIIAVLIITIYMIVSGAPAMFTIGLKDFLFGTEWAPTAADPKFGILPMILTSLVGTGLTILIGVPIALMAAVFVSEVAHKKVAGVVKPAIELLAGIPSVVYGLLGMIILVPQISKLEALLYANDPAHIFTGGANLLSGIIVLTIMILPTVVNISITSLKAVPQEYKEASLAMGATKIRNYHGYCARHRTGARRSNGDYSRLGKCSKYARTL